jgi:acetyl-CoA carboxylase beta subunit
MNQVCLAKAGPTVDKQGVVGGARVVGDLNCSSPGQIIGFADNQIIEGE